MNSDAGFGIIALVFIWLLSAGASLGFLALVIYIGALIVKSVLG